jgi:adenylate cyclase
MRKTSRYTTLAQRYTGQFPVLTYVGTQTNFWIVANILVALIIHFHSLMVSDATGIQLSGELGRAILVAVVLGIVYGVTLGLTTYYLDKKFFRSPALGRVIVLKALISLSTLILILVVMRFVLFDFLIAPTLEFRMSDKSWEYLFYLLLIYYSFMTLLISFINQINKKYGPGVLVPLLLGRYRNPKEEERIFMFMDLKSSTTTAEKLGHLKYSSFIRDCFTDINHVLLPFRAQVYQYVGDEIVVTWIEDEGLKNNFCINFYFACQMQFHERAEYYKTNYGLLPNFKAGVHSGQVTAVEIGEVKRDIAYHGDTLNTAARIQGVCNEYNKSFLVSEYIFKKLGENQNIKSESLGAILLKGKAEKVGLVSIEWNQVRPSSAS